jgi:hypothetical protein
MTFTVIVTAILRSETPATVSTFGATTVVAEGPGAPSVSPSVAYVAVADSPHGADASHKSVAPIGASCPIG